MSQIFTRVFVRPTTEYDWYQSSDDFKKTIQEKYIDTGLCLKFRERTYNDDSKLVVTETTEWSDDADLKIIRQDPIWLDDMAYMNAYYDYVGIILLEKTF